MLLSGILCKQISAKISGVGESLKSLNEGRYRPLVVNSHEPEFYEVYNEINDLNANIYSHITKEEQELYLSLSNRMDENIQEALWKLY